MRLLKQSTTAQPLVFLMVDSADHVSGKTGLTVTVTLSKSGGSFASPSAAVSEIGSGWYKLAGNATDSNTLGPLILHATATGADPTDVLFAVVAFDPQSTSMGLVLAKTTNLTGLNDIAATDVVSSGAVTTSAGAVIVATNNDKTGYALSVPGVSAVQSGLSTYSGGDTSGVTSLLARLTSTRAGYLDNLSGGAVALSSGVVLSATQSLYAPAKAGDAMTLTSGERTAIANEVEAQIIDDTDSEKVLKAITDKIAAVNPDLGGLSVGAIASAAATAVWGASGRTVDSVANLHEQTDDVASLIPHALVMTAGKVWALNEDGNPLATETKAEEIKTALASLQTHGDGAWATATGFATAGSIPSANAISENLLKYDWTSISGDPASRSMLNALRVIRNGFSITGTTMTVLKEDDASAAYTRSLTVDPSAAPVVGVS